MFRKIKKFLSGIFAETPEKKSVPPKKGKGQKQHPARNVKKTSGTGKKKKKINPPAAAAVPEKRPVIKCPDELKEVPVCEGMTRFIDLPLDKTVQFGIQHAGFEYCTAIQEITMPPLLDNRDLAGKAQTGTGKTAAFLLASFNKLLKNPLDAAQKRENGTPRMVVLAPTRELAMQIHKDASQLGIFTPLNIAVVFGGMDHEKQRAALNCQLDVLIGTPGRVIDYSRSGALKLGKVEILVIDEADRMLDMGFIPDVKRIVSQMPPKGKRQTLLFSATLDEKILHLASGWLTEPVVLESEPEKMVSDNINQTFYSVLREEKLALLLHILRTAEYERIIIFGNRKDVNANLQYDLARYGFSVPLLSGDISQEKRIKILEKFRSGKEKIVIATDVAARGIHVDDVSIVINYDLPEQPEDYIHRIGRTGRAGNTGTSVSFLCEYGAYYLPPIEELLGTQFSSILPDAEMLVLPPPAENPQLPSRPGTVRKSGRNNGAKNTRTGRRTSGYRR